MENLNSALSVIVVFGLAELAFLGFGHLLACALKSSENKDLLEKNLFAFFLSCTSLPILYLCFHKNPLITSFLFFILGYAGLGLFLKTNFKERSIFLSKFLAFSYMVLILSINYWATHLASTEFYKISIYDDLYSHLQRQHFNLYQYDGGSFFATGAYPFLETKNSNVMDFISLILLKPFVYLGIKWDLNLGMCLFVLGAQTYLLTIYVTIKRFLNYNQNSAAIACFVFAVFSFLFYGSTWFYSLHIPSVNNGFSLVIFFLFLNFFFTAENNNKTTIVLLAAPILIWSRLSWTVFYAPLFASLILIDLYQHKFKNIFIKKNILLFPLTFILCLLILGNNVYFGMKPIALKLGFSFHTLYENYLEYMGWYPRWSNVVSIVAKISPIIAISVNEILTTLICAEAIKLYTKDKLYLWAIRIALFSISISMIFITPTHNPVHYGSTEPLGSLGILRLILISFAFLAYMPSLYPQIKDALLIKNIQKYLHRFNSSYVVVLVLVVWTIFSQVSFEKATIAKNPKIKEITQLCESGEIKGLYIGGEVFTAGKYLTNVTQTPEFNSSILAANLGCLSIGEERYSLKHSASADRLIYQDKAKKIFDALKSSQSLDILKEEIEFLRAKKIGIISYTGDIFWK